MIATRFVCAVAAAALLWLPAGAARGEPAEKSCDRANFRLIVDVGHTADAPGATSARGVDEFAFNLKLAQQTEKTLVEAGFAKTMLMVSTGRSVPSMYARVARANGIQADLLLSIHHDAVPKTFVEKWDYEGKSRSYSDRFPGHSIFIAEGNADPKGSLLFAHLLGAQLKARGMAFTPHYTESFMGKFRRTLVDAITGVYRYDTLYLLKKSHVAAVLLEAGSIVNRDEELILATPERQALVGAAITDAVDAYCVAQGERRPAPLVAHARPRPHKRAVRIQSAEALPSVNNSP